MSQLVKNCLECGKDISDFGKGARKRCKECSIIIRNTNRKMYARDAWLRKVLIK
jgi:DNA-directed RNA polymerase subunit RPC12/RpoP